MSDDLAMMTATEMLRLFRARKLSPVEVTRATLDRIRRYDAKLVAFRMVAPKEALAAARESEARWMRGRPKGLIDGVPTTIKDQWLTKGWSTLRGSRSRTPSRWRFSRKASPRWATCSRTS